MHLLSAYFFFSMRKSDSDGVPLSNKLTVVLLGTASQFSNFVKVSQGRGNILYKTDLNNERGKNLPVC